MTLLTIKTTRYFVLAFIFSIVFMMVGCTVEEPEVSFKMLSLDTSSLSLTEGDETKVVATLEGVTGSITWTSSDETIATYQNGYVVALKEGVATITASYEDLSASLEVTVKAKEVTYTVKFYDDEYNLLKTEIVKKGEDATAPELKSTEEKIFHKWDKDYTNVQSDLNIVAIYKNKYSITYNLNGGTLNDEEILSYTDGEGFDLPLAHKSGCTFLGWEEENNPGDYINQIEVGKKGNLVLTAKFSEVTKVKVTFDYQNGLSEDAYLASKKTAVASYEINNYNTIFGAYWSGGYSSYSYITNKSSDPAATFSDRIYIGKDKETGLYKVINIILSGASSWPSGADYVITYSNQYSNYSSYHAQTLKVSIGDYVVFDADFTTMKTIKKCNVYYFNGAPSVQTVTKTVNLSTDQLATPTRLGYEFMGWKDSYGVDIKSTAEAYDGAKLIAQWKERTPVTAINTNEVVSELLTGETFAIKASVLPLDAYFKSIFFESSNTDILEVDENGKIEAKNTGTATIKIFDYMKKVTLEKTITVYAIDSIDLNLGSFNGVLKIGETLTIKPTAFGKTIDGVTFAYTSLTPEVISVDEYGLVTALTNGTGKLLIKDSCSNQHTLEISVVVDPLVDTERVDQVLKLLAENNIASIHAGNVGIYNDGTERYYRSTYSSVNYYLFQKYEVDKTYLNSTANPDGSPKVRRTGEGYNDTIQFVTVHDTATLTGNAANTASSMRTSGTTGTATIHYTTGQNKIYASVDEKFIAYHAGDGTSNTMAWYKTPVKAPTTGDQTPSYDVKAKGDGTYTYMINGEDTGIVLPTMQNGKEPKLAHLGPIWKVEEGYYYIGKTWYSKDYQVIGSFGGNNNSIGIEMGVNYADDIYNTWQITAQLVADICLRNNLTLNMVKMHNTWTGKNCPQSLISCNYWYNFMKMVEVNYTMMKDYSDATITFVSHNPDIVSSTGRITNPPAITTTVSYTVTVTIGEVSKSMTFYNVVPGTTTWEQWNGTYPTSKVWNDGYLSKNDIINKYYNLKNYSNI